MPSAACISILVAAACSSPDNGNCKVTAIAAGSEVSGGLEIQPDYGAAALFGDGTVASFGCNAEVALAPGTTALQHRSVPALDMTKSAPAVATTGSDAYVVHVNPQDGYADRLVHVTETGDTVWKAALDATSIVDAGPDGAYVRTYSSATGTQTSLLSVADGSTVWTMPGTLYPDGAGGTIAIDPGMPGNEVVTIVSRDGALATRWTKTITNDNGQSLMVLFGPMFSADTTIWIHVSSFCSSINLGDRVISFAALGTHELFVQLDATTGATRTAFEPSLSFDGGAAFPDRLVGFGATGLKSEAVITLDFTGAVVRTQPVLHMTYFMWADASMRAGPDGTAWFTLGATTQIDAMNAPAFMIGDSTFEGYGTFVLDLPP